MRPPYCVWKSYLLIFIDKKKIESYCGMSRYIILAYIAILCNFIGKFHTVLNDPIFINIHLYNKILFHMKQYNIVYHNISSYHIILYNIMIQYDIDDVSKYVIVKYM